MVVISVVRPMRLETFYLQARYALTNGFGLKAAGQVNFYLPLIITLIIPITAAGYNMRYTAPVV